MSKLSSLFPKTADLDELARHPIGVPNFPTRPDRATRPQELPAGQRALESAIMGKLPRVDLDHPEDTPQDGRMAAEALAMRAAKLLNDVDGAFEKMENAYLHLKVRRDTFAKRIEDDGLALVELAQKTTAMMARASTRIDNLMEDDKEPQAPPVSSKEEET